MPKLRGRYGREIDLLMMAIPHGAFKDVYSVNKFGRTTDADNGVATDVWDRANSTDGQAIWTAPTAARVHSIVSDSANDTSAGTGMRTLRVSGLTAWDSVNVAEDITLDGTNPVNTVNSYVIIHRMKMLTSGASGPNVGTITATADTDSTVTAQINPGVGQTEMAIYGIPDNQLAYMTNFYASANKGSAALSVNISLLASVDPASQPAVFVTKHTEGVNTEGSSDITHNFEPYNRFEGPCILKLLAESSSNNTDVSAGFDLILVNR